MRYRLLETIRQYAGEKLLAAGEAATVRDRHRDHFLALAERALPALWTRDQLVWLDRLEVEHDNLRAALEWSHDQPDGAAAEVRLAGALGQVRHWRGHNVEGLTRLTAALARADPAAPPVARALALSWAGRLVSLIGSRASTRPQLEEGRALALEAGDWRLASEATLHLAMLAGPSGGRAQRRALLEEALRLARRAGEPRALTRVLDNLAQDLWLAGDEAAARPLLDEGVAISRASGERASKTFVLTTLARQALDGGEYARARDLMAEASAAARELAMWPGVVRSHLMLGLVARLQGDYRRARAHLREALTAADRIGERGIVARTIYELAGLSAVLNQPRRAARLFGATVRRLDGAADGIPLDRGQAARYEHDLAVARAALGQAAFAAAWAAGEALTLEEAVAEALAEGTEG
jgi:non-specific serine/threonine protein kinase